MTDVTTDKKKENPFLLTALLASCALMGFGGLLSQGPGGMLFAFGLWVILITVGDQIIKSIEKSR